MLTPTMDTGLYTEHYKIGQYIPECNDDQKFFEKADLISGSYTI